MAQLRVLVTVSDSGSNTPEAFSEVIRQLRDHGFRVVSAGREISAVAGSIDEDKIASLLKLPHVTHVEPTDAI